MAQDQAENWIQEKINLMKSELNTDEVVDAWFLMGSPWPLFGVISAYFLFVLKLGPQIMKHRKPFRMNGILLVYNFFQVLYNGWMVLLLLSFIGGLTGEANHICSPLDKKNNPYLEPMLGGIWYFVMSKVLDLLDTIFFVLRKKQSQVTFLHVYHHSSMLIACWIILKFMRAEQSILIAALNSFVHVVMYTYYFLAALGPSVQKYLWWKPYVTKLQMIHFVMIIAFVSVLKWYQCGIPLSFTLFVAANTFYYLILFLNFYSKCYNNLKKTGAKLNHAKKN